MNQDVSVKDLEKLHDKEFIQQCYQKILGRAADEQGLAHYLNLLRSGKLRKFDIIVRLRLSPEGRKYGVYIKNFTIKSILSTLRQIPIIGWIFFVVLDLLRLPYLLQPIQAEIADIRRIHNNNNNNNNNNNYKEIDEKIYALDKRSFRIVSSLENAISIFSTFQSTIKELHSNIENNQKKTLLLVDDLQNNIEKINKNNENIENKIIKYIHKIRNEIEFTQNDAIKKYNLKFNKLNNIQKKQIHLYKKIYNELEEDRNFTQIPLYAAFENYFRGSESLIYDRGYCYLHLIKEIEEKFKNISALDLGCGRGEWLRLLRDIGIQAKGIDNNNIFIDQAKSYNLNVEKASIMQYIKKQPSDSLNIVSAFHVVEHLSPIMLVQLLKECQRVLLPGGLLIIETPNPLNTRVGNHLFYTDITHKQPLIPCSLEFFVKSSSFGKVQVYFMEGEGVTRKLLPSAQYNFTDANSYWQVSGDYAVTAKKI